MNLQTELGYLKTNDLFTLDGNIYKVGHYIRGTNGYIACTNVETHKVERFYDMTIVECGVKVINRGNCIMCGKKLTEGLFFCKECEAKGK